MSVENLNSHREQTPEVSNSLNENNESPAFDSRVEPANSNASRGDALSNSDLPEDFVRIDDFDRRIEPDDVMLPGIDDVHDFDFDDRIINDTPMELTNVNDFDYENPQSDINNDDSSPNSDVETDADIDNNPIDDQQKSDEVHGDEPVEIIGQVKNSTEESTRLDNNETRDSLSEAEREQIKSETGWSDTIIDHIDNMDQYEVYKNANLKEVVINGRHCLVKVDFDPDYVSPKTIDDDHPNGVSNRELMADGKSPYDSKTGEKLELHHMGQDYDSPFAELCENSEHGDGNHETLHDNTKQSWRRDPDLKNKYNNEDKPNHWKQRSEMV